ncbi:MAG TPA: amidase [Thermohalobaculum sp.]|nr:amidase [Thermohalobaculum sp.]
MAPADGGHGAGEPSARGLLAALAEGRVSAVETAEACLARIAEREEVVGAWAHLNREAALKQADGLDRLRRSGRPLGPLHGLPVGVKDIIDVRGMPCEWGTPLEAGRRPTADAAVIRRMRAAGALILGKTVTTEFAYYAPGKTRNPHDPSRSPGGSSQGSAAAVADGMVPLALGTQTNGSMIRPASFCGVVGYKPSFGAVPRTGVMADAPSLDTIGIFAGSVEDAALLEHAMGPDGTDEHARPSPGPLSAVAGAEPPLRPVLALVRTAAWERAAPETAEGFAELQQALGAGVEEVPLPQSFDGAIDWLRVVMAAEMARGLGRYADRGGDRVSEQFRALVEEGRAILAHDYLVARDWQRTLRAGLDRIFDRFDAIVTPAAPGEAPGPETTGDAGFCSLWSLTGLPAISLPLLRGPNGLPVGVQLVGRHGNDARLLRTARWLTRHLAEGEDA